MTKQTLYEKNRAASENLDAARDTVTAISRALQTLKDRVYLEPGFDAAFASTFERVGELHSVMCNQLSRVTQENLDEFRELKAFNLDKPKTAGGK